MYVDDKLIFGNDLNYVENTKSYLYSKFDIKYIGEANVILGVKIHRQLERIISSQSQYSEKVLPRFDIYESHGVSTPFDPNIKPSKKKRSVSQLNYS